MAENPFAGATPEQIAGIQAAQKIYDDLLQRYPDFAPLFQAVPELRPLFIRSVTEQWTTVKFAEELHKTDWWKKTPESARLWLALTVSDPAQAARQREQTVTEYYRIAAQEGISIPLQQMAAMVEKGLAEGWTDTEVRDHIIGNAKQKDPLAGGLDATVTQLQSIASDYGLPISDQNAFEWAKKIRTNRSTQDAFEETMRQQAKSMFPVLSDAIDRGISVRQYADPYAQLASQYLEINPADFDLRDPKWQSAIQQVDPKTGKLAALTLADWKSKMMTDKQYGWDYTENARSAALNLREQLADSFGFRQ